VGAPRDRKQCRRIDPKANRQDRSSVDLGVAEKMGVARARERLILRKYRSPSDAAAVSAAPLLTCDNRYELYRNEPWPAKQVGGPSSVFLSKTSSLQVRTLGGGCVTNRDAGPPQMREKE